MASYVVVMVVLLLIGTIPVPPIVIAAVVEECPGGGICPVNNTCCRQRDGSVSCVPSDMGAWNATCCKDDIFDHHQEREKASHTACPMGYQCMRFLYRCQATEKDDPLVQTLPRYHLCHISNEQWLRRVHTFPIRMGDTKSTTQNTTTPYRLKYYTNHPPDTRALLTEQAQPIRRVIVVIHGAGRNADDYFCTMLAVARRLQNGSRSPREDTLIIAPHFIAPFDRRNHYTSVGIQGLSEGSVLFWSRTDQYGDDNPWRYGANAVVESECDDNDGGDTQVACYRETTVSSFDCLDQLVDHYLQNPLNALESITILGHSAGGQFVQRWAFLTPLLEEPARSRVLLRVIVANPSSYVYLTNQRFVNNQWQTPNIKDCPDYNVWRWGLDLFGTSSSPHYVENILTRFSKEYLIQRFLHRPVIYLMGGQDRCNVSESSQELNYHHGNGRQNNPLEVSVEKDPWCNSHGLETRCEDKLQGEHRLDRFKNYWTMLTRQGLYQASENPIICHLFAIVQGVGHDHSLLFHSRAGLHFIGKHIDEFDCAPQVLHG